MTKKLRGKVALVTGGSRGSAAMAGPRKLRRRSPFSPVRARPTSPA